MSKRGIICAIIAVTVLASALVFTQVFRSSRRPLSKSTVVVRMAAAQDPQSLDPAKILDTESALFSTAQFAPLALIDNAGNLIPILAESLTMSADGLTADIILRDKSRFSDGTPVRSADVRFSFERLYAAKHPQRYVVERIRDIGSADPTTSKHADGFELLDERRLRIHLNPPDPEFPKLIANAFCAVVKEGSDTLQRQRLDSHLVGAGPFTLVDATQGGTYRFKSNPGFPLPIGADELQITIIDNDQETLARAAAGRLEFVRLRANLLGEVARFQSSSQILLRPEYENLQLVSRASENLVYLLCNFDHPTFSPFDTNDKRRWRDYISSAVDRHQISKGVYLGTAREALEPIEFQGSVAAHSSAATPTVTPTGLPQIELITANVGELRQLSEIIREQLRSKGITVHIRLLSIGDLIDRLVKKDYQIALLWLESNVSEASISWATFFGAEPGIPLFGEPLQGITPALNAARSITDANERHAALNRVLSEINHRQVRWIPLVRRSAHVLAGAIVSDAGLDSNGIPHLSLLRVRRDGK